MADGTGPGRITSSGLAIGGLLLILILASLWMFIAQPYWFPEVASVHGLDIDSVFMWVLIVTGIAFVGVQAMLGYFVARYGSQGNERAAYWHDNPKAEAILLIGTAVILTILVFMGQRVWASIYFTDAPADAIQVVAIGEQFTWNFHYPGPDGVFGTINARNASPSNLIGLDRNSPGGQDDIVSADMHLLADRAAKVTLRSKDVIHSLFLPYHRVKQDAVPGMAIQIWFVPNRAGRFEVACAELCGLGHFQMKSFLTVYASEQEFNNWQQEALAAQ